MAKWLDEYGMIVLFGAACIIGLIVMLFVSFLILHPGCGVL